MATRTQVVQKPYSKPGRTYDHLYDPLHTFSSSRDHAKQEFKAHSSFNRLRKMPDSKNMFSELRHYPRQSYQLDGANPVPAHVSHAWTGYADQYRESLVRYKTFNYAPNIKVPPKSHPPCDVEGVDRHKFFRRPILPYLEQLKITGLVFEPSKTDAMEETQRADVPKTRSVYVQTDYRDSETQTDPYSPEYVIQPGTEPELLTLATLSYSNGLPAGLAEVELIERARAKRKWEATLPPLNDPNQLDKRRRMMEQQERSEWAFRESEIKKLQDERLELVKRLLQQRETDHAALNDRKMEQLWSKKQLEKEKQIMKIRNNHIRALRKLTNRRKEVDGTLQRRNIIEDYNNFSSQVYAPEMKVGVYLDYGSEQFHVKSSYTSDYSGLMELEASLPHYILNPRIKLPQKRVVGSKARQLQRRVQQLDQVYEELKAQQNQDTTPKPLRLLEKVEKPIPRPPTPTVPIPDEDTEEQELMVILLQQVLRGRTVQTKMFEGKNRRIELIRELQTTHALQGPQITAKRKEKEAVESKQHRKQREEHEAAVVSSVVGHGAYTLIGQQLDYLSKELVRLQEERRLHAFMLLAERDRRMREAEESGLRQVEERIRRTEDELFKQVVSVHNETVDSYLEDAILSAVKSTADKQAREEIRKKAASINQVVHELEETQTSLEKHETVAELVHTFLLPEVQKQTMRNKVKHQQRKHLLAAHHAVHKDIEKQ